MVRGVPRGKRSTVAYFNPNREAFDDFCPAHVADATPLHAETMKMWSKIDKKKKGDLVGQGSWKRPKQTVPAAAAAAAGGSAVDGTKVSARDGGNPNGRHLVVLLQVDILLVFLRLVVLLELLVGLVLLQLPEQRQPSAG